MSTRDHSALGGPRGVPKPFMPPAFGAGDYIVVLKDGVSPTQAARRHGAVPTHIYRYALTGYAATLTDAALARAQADALALFVSPDTPIYAATRFNTDSGGSVLRTRSRPHSTAKSSGFFADFCRGGNL